MARKTPEQLTKEFEGRKAQGLAKGGAAYWPNVLANAVLKLAAEGQCPTSRRCSPGLSWKRPRRTSRSRPAPRKRWPG